MWMKAYRFIVSRGSLPVLGTLMAASFVAILQGAVSQSAVLLTFAAGLFQSLLLVLFPIYNRLVPIEALHDVPRLKYRNGYRPVSLAICLLPMCALISWWLGWLILLTFVFILSGDCWIVAKRFFNRQRLVESGLQTVRSVQPQVALYISGPSNVAYQVNQWLPVLERLGMPMIILARKRGIYEGMHQTSLPVILARNAAHVETILNMGIRTVLYPANPMQNLQALRHFRLNHFFINHGESDKVVNQNKLLLAYDKLLVGGPLAHRRLLEAGLKVREDQVEYVGRPQAELALEQQHALGKPIKRVLYAPTWEGFVDEMNYCSVNDTGLTMLRSLARTQEYEITVKFHPYTGSRRHEQKVYRDRIAALCREEDIRLASDMDSIHDYMNQSDLLITDVSSVLNEYLVTRKPIVLCEPPQFSGQDLSEMFPSTKAAYGFQHGDDIVSLLESINVEDTLRTTREEVRRDSLGDFEEGAFERFKSVITLSISDAVQ